MHFNTIPGDNGWKCYRHNPSSKENMTCTTQFCWNVRTCHYVLIVNKVTDYLTENSMSTCFQFNFAFKNNTHSIFLQLFVNNYLFNK